MTVSDGDLRGSARNESELLTEQQVAELCGVSPGTVRRWRFDGDLPYLRLGYRTVRHQRADVEAFLERRRVT